MTRLFRYAIDHPFRTLILAFAVPLAAAPGLLKLTIRTDGHALVPPQAPEVLFDQSVREQFGTTDLICVVVRSDHADGIFNPHTLKLVQDLTDLITALPGVNADNMSSLATEKGDRVKPGTLRFRRFLDPMPQTKVQLERLREDLEAIQLYNGTLLSQDLSATTIFVGVEEGADRATLYGAIRKVVSQTDTSSETVDVIGAPVAEALLGTHILEDLGVPAAVLGERVGAADDALPLGWPNSWYEARLWVARHIGLVPVAIAVMALVFWIAFRRFAAAMLPLIEVGAALVFVFGVMGWTGVPVYLTIAVLPVILTAIGVADEVHIFSRYTEAVRAHPQSGPPRSVAQTMSEMWIPVVKTSLTTSIGFLSFALSPIVPVQMFGLFTALGIIFCMLWSLTVIPAMLVLIPPARLVSRMSQDVASQSSTGLSWFGRFASNVLRWRWAVVVLALAIAALAPLGVAKVQKQDSWINGFAPESEFYQATQYFDEQFLGTHILQVLVDAGYDLISVDIDASDLEHLSASLPGHIVDDLDSLTNYIVRIRRLDLPFKGIHQIGRYRFQNLWRSRVTSAERDGDRIIIHPDRRKGSPRIALRLKGDERLRYELIWEPLTSPQVLRRFQAFEDFIESQSDLAVGGALGPGAYQATTNFMVRARKEGSRVIADSFQRIEELWNRYKIIRGKARLRQAVDENNSRGLITVYMTDANYVDVAELMRRIRDYERQYMTPMGMKVDFAGDVAVSQALIQAIVSTQVRSLLISLLGILAVTALMGRSLGWGIYCVLPCALAVLVNFAVMGWTGMPLGVATSMFAGMTLGIGVDYAIHLLERYRLALGHCPDRHAAIIDALTHSGPAIFIDAVAVALGFGILVLSQVPANARLGGLVVLSIAGCLAATLLLLPALLSIWSPIKK